MCGYTCVDLLGIGVAREEWTCRLLCVCGDKCVVLGFVCGEKRVVL